MNIVIATHRYPTPDRSDLISDVDALHIFAKDFLALGHTVTVVHLYQHKNDGSVSRKPFFYRSFTETLELDGVKVIRVECRFMHRLPKLTDAYFGCLARRVNRMLPKVDLLLSHFPVATMGFSERLAPGVPRAAVLHITDIQKLAGVRGETKRARLLAGYDALGFRSEALRRDFLKAGTCDKPTFLAFSGAPLEPGDAAPKTTVGDGALRVVYVGRLIARKQADLLIRAASHLECPWRLNIVGDGPERAALETLVDSLGLRGRVTFAGAVPREGALAAMREADVFAMLSYAETFGIVYLEAMAQGLIPVGTRGEGIDGVIVDGENGFLLDRDDEAGLTARLADLAAMPTDRRKHLSDAAYATACRMTERGMAETYLNLAVEAVKRNGTSGSNSADK